jgi:uncharacterized membrane protein YraQ (UPF0718 family)
MKTKNQDMKKSPLKIAIFTLFALFLIVSIFTDFTPGKEIGINFGSFTFEMVKILPFIFILIGLFDVWVKRETIEKHLGKDGGLKSFFWVFILAAPMAGGLLPALPIGYALHQKGARLSVVLTFLGAVGIGRVPMILFESTFIGWKFSVIRLLVSIPLVIVTSILLGKYLQNQKYEFPDRT